MSKESIEQMERHELLVEKMMNRLKFDSKAELFHVLAHYAYDDFEKAGDLLIDAYCGETVSPISLGEKLIDAFDKMVKQLGEQAREVEAA